MLTYERCNRSFFLIHIKSRRVSEVLCSAELVKCPCCRSHCHLLKCVFQGFPGSHLSRRRTGRTESTECQSHWRIYGCLLYIPLHSNGQKSVTWAHLDARGPGTGRLVGGGSAASTLPCRRGTWVFGGQPAWSATDFAIYKIFHMYYFICFSSQPVLSALFCSFYRQGNRAA